MLSRRNFTGVASCALCGLAEFVSTAAMAQGTPPAATPGVSRKILAQMDGPTPGYVTLLVEAEIEAGVTVARHKHPGIESGDVLEDTESLRRVNPQLRTSRCCPVQLSCPCDGDLDCFN